MENRRRDYSCIIVFLCIGIYALFTYSLWAADLIAPITFAKEGYSQLDGQSLSLHELTLLQHDPENACNVLKEEIDKLKVQNPRPELKIQQLQKHLEIFKSNQKHILPYLFWWQNFPLIGLRQEAPFYPINYPYMPHAFALWELAPSMGKKRDGKQVEPFFIDTGFAAFTIEGVAKDAYKKHQDLQMLRDFATETYNLTYRIKDILDPFEQVVELVLNFTDKRKSFPTKSAEEYVRKHIPQWIIEHYKTGKNSLLISYLCNYGHSDLSEKAGKNKILTEEGKRALREIVQGKIGIKPKYKQGDQHYTIASLKDPNNQNNVILEFVPTAPVFFGNLHMLGGKKEEKYFAAAFQSGHGSHSAGIVGGLLHSYQDDNLSYPTMHDIKQWLATDSGMCGIAPRCHTVMIKGLRSDGEAADRTIVTTAIEKAYKHHAKILNLSLKVDDQLDLSAPDVIRMQSMLSKIPYVVVSSGNATEKILDVYQTGIEGYPAKFPCIPFDVGAFLFYQDSEGNYRCPITPISQFQENIGPKFAMPGYNILSCGLVPNQKDDSMYVFMQGTSASAPMITGILTLILGEFEGVFGKKEREIILKVCYTSTFKMHTTDDWKKKTLLGGLDARTALMSLHILKSVQERLKHEKMLQKISFNSKIDNFIKAIHLILHSDIEEFIKKHSIKSSFTQGFMDFLNEIRNRSIPRSNWLKSIRFNSFDSMQGGKSTHYFPHEEANGTMHSTVDVAIYYVTQIIISALKSNIKSDICITDRPQDCTTQLFKKIQEILAQEKINLFAEYSDAVQTRIATVL